eukprot:Nitzschia sp. Nitz4//scaffold76_size158648//88541//88867//NITZ4_002552-RA/size158648-snap-gene-0.311-mRNA-1//-1//CDS//3329557863//4205//frame0
MLVPELVPGTISNRFVCRRPADRLYCWVPSPLPCRQLLAPIVDFLRRQQPGKSEVQLRGSKRQSTAVIH